MGSLLRVLVLLEASLLIAGIVVMACEGAIRRRTKRRVEAVRKQITASAFDANTTSLATALRRLPPRESVALLADLATQLVGPDRTRLGDLASWAGILDEARKWRRSRQWRLRLYGTQVQTALGASDDEIGRMLQDPHPLVRAEAARAVSTAPRPDTCRALVALLDDDALACRLAGQDALLRTGDEATAAIADALAERSGTQRSTVALIDIASRRREPTTLGSMIDCANDQDPAVRGAAIRGLGALGGPDAHRAVLAVRNDPEPSVRMAALEAMGRIGVTEDASFIVSGLFDDDWEMRRTSAIALSRLGAVGRLQLRRIARDEVGLAAEAARWILEAQGQRNPAAAFVLEGAS